MKPKLIVHVTMLLEVVALLAYGAPVAFGADAEPTLEGTYTVKGLNPDGSDYGGIARIVRRGESFLVAWISPVQADEAVLLVTKAAGVGIASGGVLAVSYYGQDVTGVILYQIEEGGIRLVGRWVTASGDGTIHSETLTRVPAPSAPAVSPDSGTQQPRIPEKPTTGRPRVVASR